MFTNLPYKYILDFYLPQHKVCVEIDGGYHQDKKQQEKDAMRDFLLTRSGVVVYRFTNDEVLKTSSKVIEFVNHYRKSSHGEFEIISKIARHG